MPDRLPYPDTRRDDTVDTLHGVQIADPYRWLEDLESDATADWVRRQNEVTESFLSGIPERAAIRERLEQVWNHDKLGLPWKRGDLLFYHRQDGLQNQAVLYVASNLDDEPRTLLDPNTLSDDGTIALGPTVVSPDGKLLAYALQESGSDWMDWCVRDVATGGDLDDRITWSKFSAASWTKDGKGFFYSAYDAPAEGKAFEGANFNQRLFYHFVGTPQSADVLVFEEPEHPTRGFGGTVTKDGRYLVISVWEGTARENRVYYRELGGDAPVVRLLDARDAKYQFVGNVGSKLVFLTDLEAPRGRVAVIDLAADGEPTLREIIPQTRDNLRDVTLVGGRLVCSYLRDAHSGVSIHSTDGMHQRDVLLPGIGTAVGFGGHPDDPETFFAFTSHTVPTTVHRLDVTTGERSLVRAPDVDFDPSAFETRQVFYESKDGTRVPMFLTHRKGLALDGNNPTLLYGYGGFDIPLTPGFSAGNVPWLEMGGVYAVANLRGGGEYGEQWHEAGTKQQKQNVFDDFFAAAEWLIAEGYTSTPKLAIHGGSNGGLLIGACMTQRPDLFTACLPAVGVLDMLRFHKFTIGWAWISDYGSPDDPELFPHLLAYSPLHNLKEGVRYPATLVMTGDHDDRVVPSHSFKFTSELQRVQAGDAPCLIRVEVRAGHGAGKPTAKILDEHADKWAFLVRVLGMDVPPRD